MTQLALIIFIFGGLSGSFIVGIALAQTIPTPFALLAGLTNFILCSVISFKVDNMQKGG